MKRAHKLHGQKLIVADLRKNEMAERSDLFIRPRQGTDQVWLMAVTKYMIDQGWHDQAFINENVNFFEEYKQSLETYTLEYAEKITGINQQTLIQIAEMIRDADGTCVLWGMGVTQNTGGSDTSAAISNLLLATGNYRRPGAGAYPLRGHNNVQAPAIWGRFPAGFRDISILQMTKRGKSSKKLTAQQSTRSPDSTTSKCFTPLKKAK